MYELEIARNTYVNNVSKNICFMNRCRAYFVKHCINLFYSQTIMKYTCIKKIDSMISNIKKKNETNAPATFIINQTFKM